MLSSGAFFQLKVYMFDFEESKPSIKEYLFG